MSNSPELKHETIEGRPALVAYLAELGGELVEPEQAKVVVVTFEDGEICHYFRDEVAEEASDGSR